MSARATLLFALLPVFAGASDVVAPSVSAPDWLPETAVIEFPGEEPITVSFLLDPFDMRSLRMSTPYRDYATALKAARADDGAAAYFLYSRSLFCRALLHREPVSLRSFNEPSPELQELLRFCSTMPLTMPESRNYWLRKAAEAGHPEAILNWGGRSATGAEGRAMLEQLWYRGYLLALTELARSERRWTRASTSSARTHVVRSAGYDWLYTKLCEAAYGAAPEHRMTVGQIKRNFEQRWRALNDEERRVALLHARSLLLETQECCTVPASEPRLLL